MHTVDYVVLGGYFLVMASIGYICSLLIKAQEDYFLGGRGFGKLLQTFAAFGAGTGSSDPVNTARTTFTSGLSGMWSVMYWLFVTPFYWITGVWYRRMRHLTLGDWFVERYQSQKLGAAYAIFGLCFFMLYGSMLFTAIGDVITPVMGFSEFEIGGSMVPVQTVVVPVIGVVVLLYGVLGGLRAAYWTDLIQGICIILLSLMLVPSGLNALVQKFGDPATQTTMDGFKIMHEQLSPDKFEVVGSGSSSEFPIYRIIAVVLINLMGVAVQPHFIATGGGSAKNEFDARVGLVTGNFLKRFCTVGWAITALIALALYADNPTLSIDPAKTWGVASRDLLAPGFTGLMIACLLAALMSSVDAHMVVGSGLVVRNLYAPYYNPDATEKEYIMVARVTGGLIVGGAVFLSLLFQDVFQQLQMTWEFPTVFAAAFWVGIVWRRATKYGAWATVFYGALTLLILPPLLPMLMPSLRENPTFTRTNDFVQITRVSKAAPSDVRRREAAIEVWDQNVQQELDSGSTQAEAEAAVTDLRGPRPEPLTVGEEFPEVENVGGQSIFWSGGVKPVDEQGNPIKGVKPQPVGEPEQVSETTTRLVSRYDEDVRLQGVGNFNLDFLLYQAAGINLTKLSSPILDTLRLPPKIIAPFLVMILISFVTPRDGKEGLDRYYAKMKTPVQSDPAEDEAEMEKSYADPDRFNHKKLFPNTDIEVSKPTKTDILGFVISVAICFAVIYSAVLLAGIGG